MSVSQDIQLNYSATGSDLFSNGSSDAENKIHIRVQQRNGRKTLTTIQGLDEKYDLKKIVKACKKEFACNGTVVEHAEYGKVIQLQGDQRKSVQELLLTVGICKKEQVSVHGF